MAVVMAALDEKVHVARDMAAVFDLWHRNRSKFISDIKVGNSYKFYQSTHQVQVPLERATLTL